MALPADFSKIFGSTATGGLTPIGDVNYAKGWEFVGSNPPTKNDFSYLQNLSDLKSQWLYSNKLQRTDPFGDIKSDGAAAVAAALSNLGLGEAAKQGVATTAQMQSGTATNLLPSVAAVMSLFSKRTFTAADYIRIPDVPGGLIIQWGSYSPTGGTQTIHLPVAFPNENIGTLAVLVGTTAAYGFVTTENIGKGAFGLHTRRSNTELATASCFTVSIGW